MERILSSILGYVKFFFLFLGLVYLSDEFWNWFKDDSLLRNAVVATIALILIDLGRFALKKIDIKKNSKST